MTYNCFGYFELCDKLFSGVPLTDNHMNEATKQICSYILKASGAKNMLKLGVGIRTKRLSESDKIIRQRLVYIKGSRAGQELQIHEIENLGHFLRGGNYADYYKREDMK